MRFFILFFFVSVTGYAQPDWVKDSKRHVEGSYIIHWGTGTAEQSDLAIFKAQQMAIKAIATECGGFYNKEVIPEKTYAQEEDGKFYGFARVAIPFGACDHAKKPNVTAAEVENPEIKKAQSLYDIMIQMDERGEKYTEMYAHMSQFAESMNVQYMKAKMEQDQFIKDQKAAYEEHISQVNADNDVAIQQIGKLRNEMDAMKNAKAIKEEQSERKALMASFSPSKRACFKQLEQMQLHSSMNAGMNAAIAKQQECAEMQ